MAFDMSCLHFTGASSLKISVLFPPAAVHCEVLLNISTKVTSALHRCSRQTNLRGFPGSGQTLVTKNVTQYLLVRQRVVLGLWCTTIFTEIFPKVCLSSIITWEKSQRTVSASSFFFHFPLFLPFHSVHVLTTSLLCYCLPPLLSWTQTQAVAVLGSNSPSLDTPFALSKVEPLLTSSQF